MIKKGFEITIFVLIFLVSAILFGQFLLHQKAELPLNVGITPEEVILSTYPEIEKEDLEYNYNIQNGYLLLYRETTDGKCEFEVGYKNDNSGYILELPGIFVRGSYIYDFKSFSIELENKSAVSIHAYKYFDDYILEFRFIGEGDAEFFCDMIKIEPFICEATGKSKNIIVINDTSKTYMFTCDYNGKMYDLADTERIIDLF